METKYWIIVEGKPTGPFTAEDLRMRRDFTAELPVWTNSLPNWTTVSEVPELAAMLTAEEPEPQEETDYIEVTSEECAQEPQTQVGSGWVNTSSATIRRAEDKPSNYLGWNVAMTLCCCMPVGLVGIFYSAKVNSRWQQGDKEGAAKASEVAAWCLILSFVLGLVGIPFQMLYSMLSL